MPLKLNIFGSESLTENRTNDFDAGSGFQGSDGNNVVSLAGVTAGSDLTITPVDHNSVAGGLKIAAGSIDAITDLTLHTVKNADKSEARAYEFADRNLQYTGQLINFIGDGVANELENQKVFTAGVIQEVKTAVSDAANAALLFVDEQNKGYKESILNATEKALAYGHSAYTTQTASNDGVTEKAFQLVGQGVTKALDTVSQFGATVIDQIGAQAATNIAAVSAGTRSDAANSLDQVVKVAGIGIVALALAAGWMGRK